MESFLQKIIDFLLPQNDIFLYIFLFISAILENLIPPIPGDTITAFGAFLVGIGRLNYLFVFISTTTGSVAGFMGLFFLGRYLEREFFMKKNYSFFKAEQIIKGEQWFHRYGYGMVFFNRFLPGIRSVISIVSGISRLNTIKVVILSLVSASVWNLIWLQIGYLLGSNWDMVKEKISDIMTKYNLIVGVILAIIVIIFVITRIVKKRNAK